MENEKPHYLNYYENWKVNQLQKSQLFKKNGAIYIVEWSVSEYIYICRTELYATLLAHDFLTTYWTCNDAFFIHKLFNYFIWLFWWNYLTKKIKSLICDQFHFSFYRVGIKIVSSRVFVILIFHFNLNTLENKI